MWAPDGGTILARVRRLLAKVPLKLSLVVIPLSLLVQEWFPFSHFPMYARPSEATYFVYITDDSGNVLPIRTEFGIFAAALKKVHKRHLKQLRERKPWSRKACRQTLDYALDYRKHRVKSEISLTEVQLFVSEVRLTGERISLDARSCARRSVHEA